MATKTFVAKNSDVENNYVYRTCRVTETCSYQLSTHRSDRSQPSGNRFQRARMFWKGETFIFKYIVEKNMILIVTMFIWRKPVEKK